ncbi:MAG: DUF6328 family protein [Roseateles sp.]
MAAQDHAHRLATEDEDGDLSDMLGELRVLLPTAQLLSAFLIAVPFAPGFRTIVLAEKHVFLATFMLSVSSLVLFTAPAVQHRLIRPLRQRASFKARASRQMLVCGAVGGCAGVGDAVRAVGGAGAHGGQHRCWRDCAADCGDVARHPGVLASQPLRLTPWRLRSWLEVTPAWAVRRALATPPS